ncbi:Cytochrome c2 [Rubellimicrobium thermophilum DSM 16684]|uniref:Cytochrome c2 n=1 Tax=Rubellimicrobium thermophilum DSM 16684 TaxID=1123069 RepID=S9QU69_9RHOB|nr:cytochrome c family protein [Rubellimicrobium thermophilum]EPX84931.1 Cytochrome c2 [Rubellimicrobium thermophilum DSM 16684]
MFDTMTLTKIVGGFCGALLVFLLGGWLASAVYGFYPARDSHAEGHEAVQGYVIPVETASAEAAPEVSVEEMTAEFLAAFANADAAAGESQFRPCAACHSLTAGENKTGPYLAGVVGRAVDSVEGFAYSGALEKVADVWTPENLNLFLANPRGFAPGTAMNFRGVPNLQDRANLIAYLAAHPG